MLENISDTDLERIAIVIRENIFIPSNDFKTTIFLCGAHISERDKMRFILSEEFLSFWNKWRYDLIYPEDIFEDLLYSSRAKDLLSLEMLLADSVDAIVLIPESPGSFAELGAFANNEKLRNKLICFVDKRYEKKKSFINKGPIKLVKKANKKAVIYFENKDIFDDFSKLESALRDVKSKSKKITNKINLLQVGNFLLPAIYLLEPISKPYLTKMVTVVTNDVENSYQMTSSGLSSLIKSKYIEFSQEGYKLTNLGLNKFLRFNKRDPRIKTHKETAIIDNLRLEILNFRYRKKRLKIG